MLRTSLSLSLLLFSCVVAFADGMQDDTPYSETVTVTASRTPVAVGDAGSSVTIIDREEIEARQSIYLSDLLRGVPGLTIGRSGGPGSLTQARARGAEANHLLVLIDGIAVNDVFAGDEIPLELLTAHDIERIEIVRGEQSGIWGADAIAGVVNIITRGVEEGTTAEVEGGAFGTTRGAGRITLGRGDARLAVSGAYTDTDGGNISRSGGEEDGATNATAGLRFGWSRDGSPLRLDLSARHIDASADFDGVDFVSTGLPADADNETDTELSTLNATGGWASANSPWSHTVRAAFATSDTRTLAAGNPDGSTAIDKTGISAQSTVDLRPRSAGANQQLTLAVDHEERDFEQRGLATPFGDPNQDQSLRSTGAAVEYRIGRPGDWSVSTSARHDDHSDFDDATTFRATGALSVGNAGTRLRASAGTGHKPPTFIERFGFFADTFAGNPELEPEESRGWELGVDQQLTERVRLGLTYFDATLENEINGFFFDVAEGVFTARNELADSERSGVELTFDATFGRTHLAATYTYTDATQPSAFGGNDEELRRPRHMANLNLRHRFERIPLDLQLNAAHTGSRTDLFFPPFPEPATTVRLDSYVLADLTARYRISERFDLFARVENLLDEDYEDIYGFATPGLGAYTGLRFTGTP